MISKCLYPLLGVLLTLTACRSDKAVGESEVLLVKTGQVKEYQDKLLIVYPGKIKAAADVDLAFRVAGPILSMPVKEGAFVRKGEVVAEIDPRDYRVQLTATEAEYKQVKAEAERIIELYERGSAPVNDYDKATYGLQQISAKYEAHKNALKDTRLLAPFDGYIQKKYFEIHETVSAGLPVVSMIDTDFFEVEIDIPSGDYIRQRHFNAFSCTIDVFPGKTFPLQLVDIVKKANLNQLYRVKFYLRPEKGVDVAAGMSVNVSIEYAPEDTDLKLIPASAVFSEQSGSAVWVYDAATSTVKLRRIEPLKFLKSGEVIIAKGLAAGEIVVTAGVHNLKEGVKVKLLKSLSDTNIGGLL